MSDSPLNCIDTRRGAVPLPAFFPVTTFGERYPLDRLIQPYLPRVARAILVSHHYAQHLDDNPDDRPDMPLFIDSGGFALLFEGACLEQCGSTYGILTKDGDSISPSSVLERQERHAEIAATLDFPIPPDCDAAERSRRFDATLANAEWALSNSRRRDLALFASLQCWDADSARDAARAFAGMSFYDRWFSGIAIGGLVPRLRDEAYVRSVIEAVRDEWAGPIHAFGVGNPAMLRNCLEWGATSSDSSSYVKYAANGRHLQRGVPSMPASSLTPLARMQLALRNLAYLNDPASSMLPLSAYRQPSALT